MRQLPALSEWMEKDRGEILKICSKRNTILWSTSACQKPDIVGKPSDQDAQQLIVTCGIGLQKLLLTCDWSGHSLAVSQSDKIDDSRKKTKQVSSEMGRFKIEVNGSAHLKIWMWHMWCMPLKCCLWSR